MTFLHLLPLLPFFLATACPGQLQTSDQKLEKRIEDLEKRIERLESAIKVLSELNNSVAEWAKLEKKALMEAKEAKAGKEENFTALTPSAGKVLLEKWSHKFVVDKYEQFGFDLGIKIRNGYAKTIKLIDGSCIYRDALGEVVFSAALQKDLRIKAGEAREIGGEYNVNKFSSKDLRMKDMQHDDLTVSLRIRKIVFEDNTVITVDN